MWTHHPESRLRDAKLLRQGKHSGIEEQIPRHKVVTRCLGELGGSSLSLLTLFAGLWGGAGRSCEV